MNFDLTILGTNAAVPYKNRWLSGQVLNIRGDLCLIDAGEGTQFRLQEYQIRRSKIDHIFISHLHGDHIFGLPGVLTSFAMEGRKRPLSIFSPKGLKDIVNILFKNAHYISPFTIHFFEVELPPYLGLGDTEGVHMLEDNPKWSVHSFPLAHRVPTLGFVFREKPALLNINSEKIKEYNLSFAQIKAAKRGENIFYTVPKDSDSEERVLRYEELTLPPIPLRSFAYCSDTAYSEAILPHIAGVDLLYHEATFTDDLADLATQRGHTTARQAGEIARKAEVSKLIIGHFSSRYHDLEPLLAEAKMAFENTELAIDGKIYTID